jgi:hypothetical protein
MKIPSQFNRDVDISSFFSVFMGKLKGFRGWYYFRMGWSTYFAFIFAAINTLTVTYYLAIEKVPALVSIFPTFVQYVLIVSGLGIPILVLIGYAHFKRSKAFQSEAEIIIESNPVQARHIANTEILLELNLKQLDIILGLYQNNKISDSELKEIKELHEKISNFKNTRTLENHKDIDFVRKQLRNNSPMKYLD